MLFPGGRLPLRIFEVRYMDMAKSCIRNQTPFGVCLIREGAEVGAPATPNEVGTLARIESWDMPQLGVLQVAARGERRFRILQRSLQADGLARACVQLLDEERDAPVPPHLAALVKLLEGPHRLDSCSWAGARLAELLPLPLEQKQALLEMDDGRARLERLSALVRPD